MKFSEIFQRKTEENCWEILWRKIWEKWRLICCSWPMNIQWEREQTFSFSFFLFKKALWVLQCCQPCGLIHTCVDSGKCADFKDFFLLPFLKKQKQNASIYYMSKYEKFLLKFPYIFSKTTLGLYFYKLYKFMKIWYNHFQRIFEFHQIIKHFYNFRKSKYKIWIRFL